MKRTKGATLSEIMKSTGWQKEMAEIPLHPLTSKSKQT